MDKEKGIYLCKNPFFLSILAFLKKWFFSRVPPCMSFFFCRLHLQGHNHLIILILNFFLRREERSKEASTPSKASFFCSFLSCKRKGTKECTTPKAPFKGGCNRSACRSYIKVSSDHQRSGLSLLSTTLDAGRLNADR